MFYRLFRAVASLLLRLFFRIVAVADPHRSLELSGPAIYVGNHPNGLVDPGLLFIHVKRRLTFLAKAPLFKIPLLNLILKGMGALPVYRRQDDPTKMAQNEGTLAASVEALVAGGAITIFPEGKSHSEPQLTELKTGCARIALDAVGKGAGLKIVPVGLTYQDKAVFRSAVRLDVGAPLDVAAWVQANGEAGPEQVRALTGAIADALRAVTLNLEQWEDLPVLETAEALYAVRTGGQAKDAERLRDFARGMRLLRDEQPERFERLKRQVRSFASTLRLLQVGADDVTASYRPAQVARFVGRQVLALTVGLPVFLVGMAVFVIPYWIPHFVVRGVKPTRDTESTYKVMTSLVLAPAWWALLCFLGHHLYGLPGLAVALLGSLPLALYTRIFFERRLAALRDARTFLLLGSRARLRAGLVAEGDALARELEQLVQEFRPRVEVGV